jgi:PAS domain-containing protein
LSRQPLHPGDPEAATEEFLRFADLFPEPLLLVSADGLVLAANEGVRRRLGLAPSDLRGRRLTEPAADPPDRLADYLRACSRTREMLPGSLVLTGDGGPGVACRCEGEVFRPSTAGAPALVLIRLAPGESASTQFLVLNQKVDELTREIARRRLLQTQGSS